MHAQSSMSMTMGRWRTRASAAALVAAAFSVLSGSTPARAATYYVDTGSTKASPVGPGTRTKPYSTISAALAAHPDTGTTFIVMPGVYREQVVPGTDGTPTGPILLRAGGSAPVVLDGADDLTQPDQWTNAGGDVWLSAGVVGPPAQVFADGTRLVPSAEQPANVEPGHWLYVDGTGLYVNVGGGNPASHAAAVGRRSHGFVVQGRSHLFIEGFTIQRAEDKGIELVGAAHVVVRRNHVTQCGSSGIAAEGGTDLQVYGNTASGNDHHGIMFRDGVTASVIDHNESFANARLSEPGATGIYLAGSPGNLVECNDVHDNQDSGCEIQTGSNDCVVRNNLSWSNGDHGYSMLGATGTTFVGNVAWGNQHDAFSLQGGSTGSRVFNCIAIDRALQPSTFCLRVDSSSVSGFDGDYNIVWNTSGGSTIRFGNKIYATASAMALATGIGSHTYQAEPRLVNAAGGDFHLLPDSPAIDAAASNAPGWTAPDADGHAPEDEPNVVDAGAGPVSFADRGAFEYQSLVLAVGGRSSSIGLALSGATPNPSARGVAFTLELACAADVSWGVFDLQGREVWSGSGARPAGSSTLAWPLVSRAGGRVPSGVYLVRVNRGGGGSATMRFVVTH